MYLLGLDVSVTEVDGDIVCWSRLMIGAPDAGGHVACIMIVMNTHSFSIQIFARTF